MNSSNIECCICFEKLNFKNSVIKNAFCSCNYYYCNDCTDNIEGKICIICKNNSHTQSYDDVSYGMSCFIENNIYIDIEENIKYLELEDKIIYLFAYVFELLEQPNKIIDYLTIENDCEEVINYKNENKFAKDFNLVEFIIKLLDEESKIDMLYKLPLYILDDIIEYDKNKETHETALENSKKFIIEFAKNINDEKEKIFVERFISKIDWICFPPLIFFID